jgi:hypothetical protein
VVVEGGVAAFVLVVVGVAHARDEAEVLDGGALVAGSQVYDTRVSVLWRDVEGTRNGDERVRTCPV